MEDQHSKAITHHAILIGINAYRERPLRGSVQDVQNIKGVLEAAALPIRIQIFTASQSSDPNSTTPPEDPNFWPTYQKVTSAFDDVLEHAHAGDFVYVHFSGHGTRLSSYSDFSSSHTGDLALMLYDRYLEGHKLAHMLNSLVKKELAVTLVLDCCFSGSVFRTHDGIRFLPNFGLQSPQEVASEQSPIFRGNRDASMQYRWLTDPSGYAIIAACGPNQTAGELEFADKRVLGALSFFLSEIIANGGWAKRLQVVYDHLWTKMRADSRIQHSPILYGNKKQSFFGRSCATVDLGLIPVIDWLDGGLQLQAGQAHGVCTGDQFDLYPFVLTDNDVHAGAVVAETIHVGPLTSNLRSTNARNERTTSGYAKPRLRLAFQKFPISLASSFPFRGALSDALKKRSLVVSNPGEPFAFHIGIGNNGQLEIRDQSNQEVQNLPTPMHDRRSHATDIGQVCDTIEHLVRYGSVRTLANDIKGDPFLSSFCVRVMRKEETFSQESLVAVEDGEIFDLIMENNGDIDLYFYVYDMGPCWQVENALHATYEIVPPREDSREFSGKSRRKIRMKIPDEMRTNGLRQCEDLFKIFITTQPTSFEWLELPKLWGERRERNSKVKRGDKSQTVAEHWAALNFLIFTSLR